MKYPATLFKHSKSMSVYFMVLIFHFIAHSLQEMNSAVITPCSHFFHAGCLKKWLYVQETCPLCHSQLKSQSPATNVPNQDAPAANPNPAGQEDAAGDRKEEDGTSAVDGQKGEGSQRQEGDKEADDSSSSNTVSAESQHFNISPHSPSHPAALSTEPHPQPGSSDEWDTSSRLSVSHQSSSELQAKATGTPSEQEPTQSTGHPEPSAGFPSHPDATESAEAEGNSH